MTQVKFNNEKWWVLHQDKWIEIEQKDWEKVKRIVWNSHARFTYGSTTAFGRWVAPDQIYSLPEEVEFEIKDEFIIYWPGIKKVAHLKDSEPKKESIQFNRILVECTGKINSQGYCDKCFERSYGSSSYCTRMVERGEEVKKEPLLDRISLMLSTITEIVNGSSNKTMSEIYIKIIDLNDELGEHIRLKDSQSEIERLLEINQRLIKAYDYMKASRDEMDILWKNSEAKIKELESKLAAQQEVIENREFELDGAIKKLKELSPKEEKQSKESD